MGWDKWRGAARSKCGIRGWFFGAVGALYLATKLSIYVRLVGGERPVYGLETGRWAGFEALVVCL